jgi:hypothetical protein
VKTVYVALVEIRPRKGAQLDPEKVAGAAVRCYVPADSEDDARRVLGAALAQACLELREIEFCHLYDSPDWQQADDGSDASGVQSARARGAVAFGTFHTWGHDAPDTV